MIKSLRIQNLATIEDIELQFQDGFSILTGETGTGKSIIIGGLKLILGEKGTTDIIRTGEEETSVEAIFQADSPEVHFDPSQNQRARTGKRISQRDSCSHQTTERNRKWSCRYLRSERSHLSQRARVPARLSRY